ncbi:pimeloyl-ACP methyl ester carboxylesterase [Streptacidiphilus sp. MAP12-20]|uniref:alpha/beta fold hydrolase n=1 Tax=Streptacidiphilus sp. MAP12-20 TaxID=3156299 RepID=UPI0035149673
MTAPAPAGTTRTIELRDGLTLTVQEFGENTDGTGVLMLHGGAGPRSMAGFAAGMSQHAYVVVPTHPGFDGTPRPGRTDTVADLATAYLDLLDELDLRGVMVAGSSVGGWIAAEMALRDNRGRIACLTLLGSTGIAPEPPVQLANPAEIGPARTGELAFHNPDLRIDPAALSAEQLAAMAANQRTLAIYAGDPFCHDPKLRGLDQPRRIAWAPAWKRLAAPSRARSSVIRRRRVRSLLPSGRHADEPSLVAATAGPGYDTVTGLGSPTAGVDGAWAAMK